MTCRCKKTRKAAMKAAEEALEQGTHAFEEVVDYVTPRAQHARQQVVEFVVPVLEDARERIVPAFEDARDYVAPRVAEVAEHIPPAIQHAYETISDKVEHDVYPRLHELWEQASDNLAVQEASRRGRSAVAALRGDLTLPATALVEPEPAVVELRSKRGIIGKVFAILGLAALVGAVVLAVRVVLGSKDDGWSPAQPMRPDMEDESEWGDSPFGDDVAGEPDVDTTQSATVDEAEQLMVAEGGPLDTSHDTPAAHGEQGYGDGAFIGSEPPAGFNIKGNERSMKYHVPEAAGYDRTNADVWFNSEEAAQAAGFTRALR